MNSLLLRLEGPLQSWGTQGRFGLRDTDREPSKSGVVGLLAAAMGVPREDDFTVQRLAAMDMAVRVDREGSLVSDYHTVGAGIFRNRPHSLYGQSGNAVTTRMYLADASFCVALGSEDRPWIERLASAVASPVWPLFLGRRSCPPSVPVLVGVEPGAPEAVLRTVDLPSTRVRLVLESTDGAPRTDVPISFVSAARRFRRRFVRTEWIEAAGVAS